MADCIICLSRDGFDCSVGPFGSRDASLYECPVCGVFGASRNAIGESLNPENVNMGRVLRAALSHRIRTNMKDGCDPVLLMTHDIEQFVQSNPKLPTPSQQSLNAIRFIGEILQESFEPLGSLPPSFQAAVGAPTRQYSLKLVRDLARRGLVEYVDAKTMGKPYNMISIDLTLDGWDLFEKERTGQLSTDIGFIAMKFGDEILDPFVRDVIKPCVQMLGYNLIDLRDVSQAGIIDNILRAQIRDAKFVIIDLSHDNSGAYWEAGFAEGLGKPVIYICERGKFDEMTCSPEM